MRVKVFSVAMLIGAMALLAACSGNGEKTAGPGATAVSGQSLVNPLIISSDLAVGNNRFVFALLDDKAEPIDNVPVHVRFFATIGGQRQAAGETDAVFRTIEIKTPHEHESGEMHQHVEARGVYMVDSVSFNAAGIWDAELTISMPNQQKPVVAMVPFQVNQRSSTPPVGSAAPATKNKTVRDVKDISEIDTSDPPRPEMHSISVADAIAQGKPFVVVFATPAFCRSAVCGPVTDIVAELQGRYGDGMAFIHIEPYKLEPLRTKAEYQLAPETVEWGLLSEPWVFVVDANGKISAKFEGIVTSQELEAALQRVLGT